MKIERLETERLILRTYEERDLQDLYEYLSDEDVVAFEPYEPMNLEEVKKCLEDRIVSGEFLAIEERITGKMIGNIYVSERYAESVEIGYVVNRRFWKKGCISSSVFPKNRKEKFPTLGMGYSHISAGNIFI